MNLFQGITFYDAINRLIIGFLASLWIAYFKGSFHFLDCWYCAAIYLISCYVFGLFFSLLIDAIANKSNCCIKSIFYKNNPKVIREIASKYNIAIQESENTMPDYWRKYFTVQKNMLLGNVPAMETISAFMLNLSGLSIFNIIVSLIGIALTCQCCLSATIIVLSILFIPVCVVGRNYVERKIYTNILSAYKFIEEDNH